LVPVRELGAEKLLAAPAATTRSLAAAGLNKLFFRDLSITVS
jgi:hypothetical protein